MASRVLAGTLLVSALLVASCTDSSRGGALPLVGPFASFNNAPIGQVVAELLRERPDARRAPLGGVREVIGDWVVHYDVPAPTSEDLFPAMRVTEISALRALPDTQSAVQLQDSLLAVIRSVAAPECVLTRRGRERVPSIIMRGENGEYLLGFWSREAPSVNADSTSTAVALPVVFALTFRAAGVSRPDEEPMPCGVTTPAAIE